MRLCIWKKEFSWVWMRTSSNPLPSQFSSTYTGTIFIGILEMFPKYLMNYHGLYQSFKSLKRCTVELMFSLIVMSIIPYTLLLLFLI